MDKLRLILLGLAVALVAVLGWRFFSAPTQQAAKIPAARIDLPKQQPAGTQKSRQLSPNHKLAATRQLISKRLAEAPEFQAFFARFKLAFPAAHNRILDGFVDKAQKVGRIELSDLYLAQALSGLRSSHGVLAAKAAPARLKRIFEIQASILKTVADRNPKLCADYLHGSASPLFFEFSASHRKLVGDMAHAGLEAIVDGRTSKIERPVPNAKDFKLIEAALRKKGLEKPEIEALLDGKISEPPLADKTICRAGQIFFETLRTIPEDLRMKIYAHQINLMARS